MTLKYYHYTVEWNLHIVARHQHQHSTTTTCAFKDSMLIIMGNWEFKYHREPSHLHLRKMFHNRHFFNGRIHFVEKKKLKREVENL